MLPGLIRPLGVVLTPVIIGTVNNAGSGSNSSSYTTSLTVTTTPAALLIIGVTVRDTSALDQPAVTWNSLSCTNQNWTSVGSTTKTGMGWFTLPITAGTNTTANIVATFVGAKTSYGVMAVLLTNLQSNTPIDKQLDNSNPGAITIATSDGGALLAYSNSGQSASTFTWNVGTEDFDSISGSGSTIYHSGMHMATTGGNVSLTATRSVAPASTSGLTSAITFR